MLTKLEDRHAPCLAPDKAVIFREDPAHDLTEKASDRLWWEAIGIDRIISPFAIFGMKRNYESVS
jgi:hypothetical protein